MRNRMLVSVLTILGVAAFLYGIWSVFSIALGRGDFYPAYSSLASDMAGTKVFYESLSMLDGMSVTRNYGPFSEIKGEHDATALFLGQSFSRNELVPHSTLSDMESFVSGGGRLVITYLNPAGGGWEEEPQKKKEEAGQASHGMVSLNDRWKIQFAEPKGGTGDGPMLRATGAPGRLPRTARCRASLVFERLGPSWQVIYSVQDQPVMVEKRMGKGSIVMSALSCFCANASMGSMKKPELLAWLIGDHSEVIFDEYSHGLQSSPGIAMLARRYGLQPLFAATLVLVALFLWKSAVPLVPPYRESFLVEGGEKGRGSVSGLRNLLRRSIPSYRIFQVCFAEWRKSLKGQSSIQAGKFQRAESVLQAQESLPRRQRSAISAYNSVCKILKEKVG